MWCPTNKPSFPYTAHKTAQIHRGSLQLAHLAKTLLHVNISVVYHSYSPSPPSLVFHYCTWHLRLFVANSIVIKMRGVACIYNKGGGEGRGACTSAPRVFFFFWQRSLKWLLDYPIYNLRGKPFWLMKTEKIQFNSPDNSEPKGPYKSAISS